MLRQRLVHFREVLIMRSDNGCFGLRRSLAGVIGKAVSALFTGGRALLDRRRASSGTLIQTIGLAQASIQKNLDLGTIRESFAVGRDDDKSVGPGCGAED